MLLWGKRPPTAKGGGAPIGKPEPGQPDPRALRPSTKERSPSPPPAARQACCRDIYSRQQSFLGLALERKALQRNRGINQRGKCLAQQKRPGTQPCHRLMALGKPPSPACLPLTPPGAPRHISTRALGHRRGCLWAGGHIPPPCPFPETQGERRSHRLLSPPRTHTHCG